MNPPDVVDKGMALSSSRYELYIVDFKFALVFFEIFSLFKAGDEMAITSYFT